MNADPAPVPTLSAAEFHQGRKFVDTDYGRIAYVERGSGPVALFVHGALLNGYQWRHQLAGLSDIRRVIAVDTMAMGYTEKRPDQPLGMKQQAGMLRAVVDALGIDQVDLVGNDSGGGAALIFAANNPQRVRTLALTNCEVHDYDEATPSALQFRELATSGALVATIRQGLQDVAVGKAALAIAYQRAHELPDDAVATYFEPLVRTPERVEQLLAYIAATTNRDTIEIEAKLRTLAAPTLVLWGTGDGFFPVKWAYWLRDNLPNVVEVVEIEGAPVFWPEEEPRLLNEKLRELWTR